MTHAPMHKTPIREAITTSTVLAGMLIVVVGFTGSLVLTFDVANKAHLTNAQLGSWVFAITVGTGILSLGMSWWYRQPVIMAWSTPGLALLASSLGQYSLGEAVGAYLVAGLMIAALGASGLFSRIMQFVPQNVALAVLAGVLWKYGLGLFQNFTLEPVLVGAMIVAFFVAQKRSTVPMMWALLVGFGVTVALGKFQTQGLSLAITQPVWIWPSFSAPALLGLGLPLLLLALASQNAPGFAVMQAHGYTPPVRGSLVATGLLSAALAPMLCHGLTLAAITAALANNDQAHSDPKRRYGAGLVSGALQILLGIFGTTIVAFFLALPHTFVAAMTGLALSGTIQSCIVGAFQDNARRHSSMFALLITASEVSVLGLGSAFWGLGVGTLLHVLLERKPKEQKPKESA